MVAAGKHPPHLAAVLVGDDGASQNYVGMKVDCEEVGFGSTTIRMKASTTEAELLAKIDELNSNDAIDGVLLFNCHCPHRLTKIT